MIQHRRGRLLPGGVEGLIVLASGATLSRAVEDDDIVATPGQVHHRGGELLGERVEAAVEDDRAPRFPVGGQAQGR